MGELATKRRRDGDQGQACHLSAAWPITPKRARRIADGVVLILAFAGIRKCRDPGTQRAQEVGERGRFAHHATSPEPGS